MSFMATHLVGFGAGASGGVETLVDRTLGTNIGNMTGNGGLAASFDGTTSQGYASCSVGTSNPSYVGKDHGSAKYPSKIIAYGPNNLGYSSGAGTVTLYFMVNNSSPASATDGTSLGSTSFTDLGDESTGRTITASDTSTAYRYWWLRIECGTNICCAEVQMYELV